LLAYATSLLTLDHHVLDYHGMDVYFCAWECVVHSSWWCFT
jgi:hypothetical protein